MKGQATNKEKWPAALECAGTLVALIAISLGIGYPMFSAGLAFGFALALVNYYLLNNILNSMLVNVTTANGFGVAWAVLKYHLRFWVLGFVLFLVFSQWGTTFGLATIVGMSLPRWFQVYKELRASLVMQWP